MGAGASLDTTITGASLGTTITMPRSSSIILEDAPPPRVVSCSSSGFLLTGDVIVRCGGVKVRSREHARLLIDACTRGDGHESLRLTVQRPTNSTCILSRTEQSFGVTLNSVSGQGRVVVVTITPGSVAARSGTIVLGAIVLSINGEAVSSARAAAKLLQDVAVGDKVKLELLHPPGAEWPRRDAPATIRTSSPSPTSQAVGKEASAIEIHI